MSILKNTGGQKIAVLAVDLSTTPPSLKVDDEANITAQISLDGGASAAVTDTNPTQLDSTNHPGVYLFDLTQGETNADVLVITSDSTTTSVAVDPVVIYTESSAVQTGDSYVEIGTAGAGLTALPWNSAWDVEVESEVADALAAFNAMATTDLPSNFSLLAISGDGVANASVQELVGNAVAAQGLLADYNGIGFNKTNSSIGTASTIGNAPTNWSSLSINGSGHIDRVTLVDANTDMWSATEKENIRHALNVDGTQTAPTTARTVSAFTNTGNTVYSVFYDKSSQVWNGAAFVAFVEANWSSYAIAMTEVDTSGKYDVSAPVGTTAFESRVQAGGSPDVDNDDRLAAASLR